MTKLPTTQIWEGFWNPNFLERYRDEYNHTTIFNMSVEEISQISDYFIPTEHPGSIVPQSLDITYLNTWRCLPLIGLDNPNIGDTLAVDFKSRFIGKINSDLVIVKFMKYNRALSYIIRSDFHYNYDLHNIIYIGNILQIDPIWGITEKNPFGQLKVLIQPYIQVIRPILNNLPYEHYAPLLNSEVLLGIGRYLWYLQTNLIDLDLKANNLRSVGKHHNYKLIDLDFIRYINVNKKRLGGIEPINQDALEMLSSLSTHVWRTAPIFDPRIINMSGFVQGIILKYLTAPLLFIDQTHFDTILRLMKEEYPYNNFIQNIFHTAVSNSHKNDPEILLKFENNLSSMDIYERSLLLLTPINHPKFLTCLDQHMSTYFINDYHDYGYMLYQWHIAQVLRNLTTFIDRIHNDYEILSGPEIIAIAAEVFQLPELFYLRAFNTHKPIEIMPKDIIEFFHKFENKKVLRINTIKAGIDLLQYLDTIIGKVITLRTTDFDASLNSPVKILKFFNTTMEDFWLWIALVVYSHYIKNNTTTYIKLRTCAVTQCENTLKKADSVILYEGEIIWDLLQNFDYWNLGIPILDKTFTLLTFDNLPVNLEAELIQYCQTGISKVNKGWDMQFIELYNASIEFLRN